MMWQCILPRNYPSQSASITTQHFNGLCVLIQSNTVMAVVQDSNLIPFFIYSVNNFSNRIFSYRYLILNHYTIINNYLQYKIFNIFLNDFLWTKKDITFTVFIILSAKTNFKKQDLFGFLPITAFLFRPLISRHDFVSCMPQPVLFIALPKG